MTVLAVAEGNLVGINHATTVCLDEGITTPLITPVIASRSGVAERPTTPQRAAANFYVEISTIRTSSVITTTPPLGTVIFTVAVGFSDA